MLQENLHNLAKEIYIQVQEAQRVPNKLDARRPTPRHIIIKMPKVKDKERYLKGPGENQLVTYKGVPIRLSADFLNFEGKKGLAKVIQSDEVQGPTT